MPRLYEGSGPKRRRVSIQAASLVTDSLGQETTAWSTTRTVWAHISTLRGDFVSNAGQQKDCVLVEVIMRYFPGLGPSQRILFGSRVFSPYLINNIDERNREYIVRCQEIVGVSPG